MGDPVVKGVPPQTGWLGDTISLTLSGTRQPKKQGAGRAGCQRSSHSHGQGQLVDLCPGATGSPQPLLGHVHTAAHTHGDLHPTRVTALTSLMQ